ncbi:maltase 1-like [Gigantopelta aegis]|uniref:maltase 1-like n=1 Tax=Gigantopelta aegis TaxID=1735272 RepID=UPI001B88983E|nr:maltase 1-like [Gigantopelta aegis]
MTDANTNKDEKIPIKPEEVDDADVNEFDSALDDSKAHFLNGGKGGDDSQAVVEIQSGSSDISFTGLTKEDLEKYAKDPFWIRLRIIVFALFWIGWVVMLVAAIVIIVLAPRCPHRPDLKWYNKEVVYQVYPESFQDSDGDGVGDIQGIRTRFGYFKDLGVKSIALGSIFKKDDFNAIVDHKDVDPKLGTLADVESFLKFAKIKGVKVIFDFIPNYTSRNHTWFVQSQKNDDKYKDFYVWADPVNGGVPNNWKNVKGVSAWTLDPTRNQYYLHQFSEAFPELNLHNEDVKKELEMILRFWLDRDVRGFHLVDAEFLVENEDLADEDSSSNDHMQTRNYNETYSLIKEWRKVLDGYSDKPGRERMMYTTLSYADKDEQLAYYGDDAMRGLNVVVGDGLMKELTKNCNADCLRTLVDAELTNDTLKQWPGWMLGNKDTSRLSQRLGNGRAITAYVLQMLLPGTVFNYYGDELGMVDGVVSSTDTDGLTNNPDEKDRLKYRTPMQWNASVNAGFSSGKPWLPVNTNYKTVNLGAKTAVYSGFNIFKAVKLLIALREQESNMFGKLYTHVDDGTFWFVRKAPGFPGYLVAINLGSTPLTHKFYQGAEGEVTQSGKVVFHSENKSLKDQINLMTQYIELGPGTAVVIEMPA